VCVCWWPGGSGKQKNQKQFVGGLDEDGESVGESVGVGVGESVGVGVGVADGEGLGVVVPG